MLWLILSAAVVIAGTVWFLARPLTRTSSTDLAVEDRQELMQVRDRLLAQLDELDLEAGDQNVDPSVVEDERRRLEGGLAQVLRRIEDVPVAVTKNSATTAPLGKTRRAAVVALVLGVPIAAVGLYGAVEHNRIAFLAGLQGTDGAFPPQVLQMVARLAQRLEREPNDPQGWARLGRAYQVMGRVVDAHNAYARAYGLAPGDPVILADYATLLMAQDPGRPGPEAQALFQRLHKLDPKHPGALWVLGLVAYNAGEFARAEQLWSRLLTVLPAENEVEPQVRKAIAEARVGLSEKKKN